VSGVPGGRFARWTWRDHTRGSLRASLAVLALPLLASSASGVLFQLVDLAFVSRLGEDAMTAVIVSNQALRQVAFLLAMGASFGAQALVARAVGEGRPEAAERLAGQVVLLGAGLGAAFAAVGVAFAEPLLAALRVSPAVLAIGVPYVRLVFLLAFGFVFLFLFSAILNGAGDTLTPLLVALVQTAVALLAEWILIFGGFGLPPLGVTGVALGVAAGQAVAIALALRVLFGGRGRVHVRRRHLRPDPAALRGIVALAWPPALQMVGGFLVTVVFLRLAGGFGEHAQTAYSIGLRLGMVGPMLAFPIAGACATLVGQSLGAGDPRRAWRALGTGLAVHAALLWAIALALALLRREIVAAFASEPEVIAIGSELLLYQSGVFFFFGFYFVFFRALQGAGDVAVPMALSIANSLLLTAPLGAFLSLRLGWGPTGLFAASLAGAAAVTLATGAYLATGRWARPRG
jgi:putative MATE family efflux protein